MLTAWNQQAFFFGAIGGLIGGLGGLISWLLGYKMFF